VNFIFTEKYTKGRVTKNHKRQKRHKKKHKWQNRKDKRKRAENKECKNKIIKTN